MRKIKENAFLNRIHVRAWFFAAFVGCFSVGAHAGYAQLAPPPGWSRGASGGSLYQSAANETWLQSTVRTNATLNVGGQSVKVPAAMRLASNAPRFLSGRIGAALAIGGSSVLTGGLTLAAAMLLPEVIDWVSNTPYRWDSGMNQFVQERKDLVGYWADGYGGQFGSADAACKSLGPFHAGNFYDNGMSAQCLNYANSQMYDVHFHGTEITAVVPVDFSPVVDDALSNAPLPEKLPNVVWPLTWPVEDPVINPSPALQPQPLFVPTGNPVPNPQYDPNAAPSPSNQPWIQPGVRVVPSPTPANPWQVDIQPVDLPRPNQDPYVPPVVDPSGDPVTDPSIDPSLKPKPSDQIGICDMYPSILACAEAARFLPKTDPADPPKDETLDFCKTNPDAVACQKPDLDTPDGEIPKANRDVSLQEENLFVGGSCPADVYFAPQGLQQFKIWDWNQACGYISGYVQPILIICCTFAAFMILIPGRTE